MRFSIKTNNANKINVISLEIPLALHCNLKCDGCSHHAPYVETNFYNLEQFAKDIGLLKDVYHAKKLLFLGGEPLLNKRINEYIEVAKKSNIADSYGVITNGILLFNMDDEFFDAIDDLQISLYPGVGMDVQKLGAFINEKARRYNFTCNISKTEYFINMETDKLSDEKAQTNFQLCSRKRTHYLYNGYYYRCNRPVTTQQYLIRRRSTANPPDFKVEDGVALNGDNLYVRLAEYINRKHKLLSCHFCLSGLYNNTAYLRFFHKTTELLAHTYRRFFLGNKNFLALLFINLLKKIYMKIPNKKRKYHMEENFMGERNVVTAFKHNQLKGEKKEENEINR